MTVLFLVCAIIGGTILLTQVTLMLLGMGGDGGDFDASGDLPADVGGDFHGDTGGDFHGDAGGHGHSLAGHGSSWLFNVVSFRTVVAAMAFFGVAGMAGQSAGASTPTVLLIAIAAGAAAMYGVYWMMQGLYRLRAEGTVRIHRAIGHPAKVYLTIPGHNAGAGKIQINLQNRTMEYLATTQGESLPTGAKVVIVNVLTENTLEVEPADEQERIGNA